MSRQLDPTKRKLTDVLCKSSKPRTDENGRLKTVKYSDGYGLNLEVRHDGKFWFYAFCLNGKQLKLSLGSYLTVRLSDARAMHEKAWLMVQKGEDPREGTITRLQLKRLKDQDAASKLEQKAKEEAKSHRTFRVIAEQWFIKKEPIWIYSTAFTQSGSRFTGGNNGMSLVPECRVRRQSGSRPVQWLRHTYTPTRRGKEGDRNQSRIQGAKMGRRTDTLLVQSLSKVDPQV